VEVLELLAAVLLEVAALEPLVEEQERALAGLVAQQVATRLAQVEQLVLELDLAEQEVPVLLMVVLA